MNLNISLCHIVYRIEDLILECSSWQIFYQYRTILGHICSNICDIYVAVKSVKTACSFKI